jgi:hypothetical protein
LSYVKLAGWLCRIAIAAEWFGIRVGREVLFFFGVTRPGHFTTMSGRCGLRKMSGCQRHNN